MSASAKVLAPADNAHVVAACEVVAEVLALPRDEVHADVNVVDELGAESLDFIDIVFRLEERFGIVIRRGALEQAARGDMSEDEFAPRGTVSERGLERLRELFPEARPRIRAGLHAREIIALFSPRTFARIVAAQLAAAPLGAAQLDGKPLGDGGAP